MAAASHLNLTSSGRKTSFGTAKPSAWQPPPLPMHVTRPKSAKGRTRSSLNHSHSVADYACQAPLALQPLARCEDPFGGRRASSSQQLYQPVQAGPAEIPDILQKVPVRTSSSLNKYRVLPSITRRELKESAAEEGSEQAGESQANTQPEEKEWASPPPLEAKPPNPRESPPALLAMNLEEPCEGEPRLLLAVRSPSGRRLERHFRPSDSLQTIVAAAAAVEGTSAAYRRCRIKTTEVPRRTFADLSKTLQECGIVHKSVLCISAEEDA
uniref:UBX domain protein 10 n=1 Tax=Salvator merianae TaxID=96440 RepID=A0A8D0BRJ6_SALMN